MIVYRIWESDDEKFGIWNEVRLNLIRTSKLGGGADHDTLATILSLLVQYKVVIDNELTSVEMKVMKISKYWHK